ncbi:hypothetical protein Cob_v007344 [Colletotrichum orbiculare MAFF 240422]|uniref:Uncharacterized protein n=1 Tax=Colletotrichum orbiculare (strain 104-T / ATCC 96160 / CBS 514.97 / LARS 414 / MAFF 240422) TaxID=1213857 RepID=A0A484FRU3_COLOR|nr:hypothetical protein Cob_v007344 [Colletotrichum orbiculare MAFF 240422]
MDWTVPGAYLSWAKDTEKYSLQDMFHPAGRGKRTYNQLLQLPPPSPTACPLHMGSRSNSHRRSLRAQAVEFGLDKMRSESLLSISIDDQILREEFPLPYKRATMRLRAATATASATP